MSARTSKLIVGYEYPNGYHGTDIVTARTIFSDGLSLDSYGTDIAPADNYELAKGHGNKMRRARTGEFAVIGVTSTKLAVSQVSISSKYVR